MRFPRGQEGSIVGLDVSGWVISANSKNKDAAWKFIEFLSTDKSLEILTQDGLIFPAKINVANSNVFLAEPPRNARAFIEVAKSAVPTPVTEKYAEINDLLDENLEGLFNGNISIDDAVSDELILRLNKLLN